MPRQQLFSPGNAFIQGRAAAQQYRAGEQRNALAQMELDNAPAQMQRRNRLVELQVEGAEMGIDVERAKLGYARLKQALDSGDPKAYVLQREPDLVAKLQQQGIDLASLDNDTAARVIDGFAREYAGKAGMLPGNQLNAGVQSTFVGKNGNLWLVGRDGQVRDTGTPVSQFAQRPVEAAGGLYSFDPGRGQLTGQIASPGSQINASAREAAAVQGAKDAASADVDLQKKQIENSKAYDAFTIGMKNLETAMSQTRTDPITGLLPPLTAAAQTAQGAQATMAPILKQLFRSAGEGTFTDRDQELLLDMVPTRKDHPEARKAKIQMIDSIVRAKLGIASAFAPASGEEPATDPRIQSLLDKYAPQQ